MDLHKITIFIAGSTHSQWVNETKQKLKSLQLDMRYRLEKEYNMSLFCTDCDNPAADNNQEKYNAQITDDSDVFILLVDKAPVGPYSMEELIRASLCNEEKDHPQVYVYFAKELQADSYVKELVNVVKSMTGRYSVFTDNPEDIKQKVSDIVWNIASQKLDLETKRRIAEQKELERKKQEEAEARMRQEQEEAQAKRLRLRQRITNWMLCVLLVLIVGGASIGSFYFARHKDSAPILLTGSGTVRSYLDSCHVNIANRNDGLYIHLPTGDTWVMLGEEQKVDEETREGERKYYPIIFAADDLRDNMRDLKIDDEKEYLKKVGHIVDVTIGQDPLFVTIPTDPQKLSPMLPFLHHLDDNAITSAELADIITQFSGTDSICVYHTTPTSGTVATFQKSMIAGSEKVSDSTQWCWTYKDKVGHSEYNNKTTLLSDVVSTPFLVLESEYYHIRGSFSDSRTRQLRFIGTDNQQIKKQLHLYFVLRRKTFERDDFEIAPPLYRFLTEVVDALHLEYKVKKEYIGVASPQIIISLKELSNH